MYEPHRKCPENEKQYNLNSFRGQYSDKGKIKDYHNKELLLSIDKNEDKYKNKPRLLTARLPAPFSMKTKGEENISPKKIIVDKQIEKKDIDPDIQYKQLNSYYTSYVN
jgi:hypothetical protein